MRGEGNRKGTVAGAAFFLFAAILLAVVCVLLGSAQKETLPSVLVLPDEEESYLPILTAERGGKVLLVCSGREDTLLLRLDRAGQVELKKKLPVFSSWAAVRGSSLLVREDTGNSTALTAYNVESFTEISHTLLPCHSDEMLWFDCDPEGNIYYSRAQTPAILRTLSSAGGERQREFPGSVDFLETAEDGSLLVFAGGKLFFGEGEDFQEISCLSPPWKRLSSTVVLDRDGVVSDLREEEENYLLFPRFRCSEYIYDTFSFCLDGENCLILSNTAGTVTRYSADGTARDTCHLPHTALGVCPAGAVFREKDGLHFSAFAFSPETSTPEPSPPSEPVPEEPPLKMEGSYLLLSAGTTVPELRELFRPESVEVFDLSGRPLYRGSLATGMTVEGWTVVVLGDCNGTGTVNSADLRVAMTMLLADTPVDDPSSRAADLNHNGELDTEDLVLMNQLAYHGKLDR